MPNSSNNYTSVWSALPGSQALAVDSRCHHTLHTGTRGPGKTAGQLARFWKYVGKGYGDYWRGVIFGQTYGGLDDIITQSQRMFPKLGDGCKFSGGPGSFQWEWPSGEVLLFRSIQDPKEYMQRGYHGSEYPYIGWHELTNWGTGDLYQKMMSCNRSSFVSDTLEPIPLIVHSTTNSGGPGHNWVKRKFIDVAPYGKVVRNVISVEDPKTHELTEVTKTQITLFGNYKENPFLSVEYIAELASNPNENERRAWFEGSWDVTAGGAIDDLWRREVHVIPQFAVPESWKVDRAMDWGSSHPFSVGWFAEANGEEAYFPDGRVFCPPPGTLIQIWEAYGAKYSDIGLNKGIKLGSDDLARLVIKNEMAMWDKGILSWDVQPKPGPADNQISKVDDTSTDSIERKMAKLGVRWRKSDKSPGSRKVRMQLFRDRLLNTLRGEGPGLYITNNCRASIATIPVLPRDPKDQDDVDTSAEDHCWDMWGYRLLSGAKETGKLKVKWSL